MTIGRDHAERPTERPPEPQPLPRQRSLFAAGSFAAEVETLQGEDTVVPAPLVVAGRAALTDNAVNRTVAPSVPLPVSADRQEVAVPARLYLTADLRAATGLPRTATDFYLRTGVLRPTARAESGYLLFDERELTLLHRVLEWRARGIGLREIKARLGR